MTPVGLVRFCRTWWRFRAVRREFRDSGALLAWQHVALRLGLEFLRKEPLGNSILQGIYDGRAVEVSEYFSEIRVITRISMTLSVPAPPALVARVNERTYVHEQTTSLLAETAAYGNLDEAQAEVLRDSFDAHIAHLHISETYLSCDARYVVAPDQYIALLASMRTVVRVLEHLSATESPA